jgi:hypothetical protein
MISAEFARWAAFNAPRITNAFLPLAAMQMAFFFLIIAWSMILPLTSSAFEFGNNFWILGGRPTETALLKSVDDVVMDFLLTCISHEMVVLTDRDVLGREYDQF